MYSSNQTNSQPSAQMIRILWRQQQELLRKAPDCVNPIINNEDPLDIQADIIGPKGTPYEEGIFRVKLCIPGDFPQAAPKGLFVTKIYHPNVSEKGEICVNTLKKDWNPKQWSLYNLFEVIKCLLIVPFPESSLNEEAGKVFMENYDEYCKIARIYTNVHAKKACTYNEGGYSDDIEMKCDDEESREIGRSKTLMFPKRNFENKGSHQIPEPNFNSGEKPKLGLLPFMRSNSLRIAPNTLFSGPLRASSSMNVVEQTKRNNKEDINKWLMRI